MRFSWILVSLALFVGEVSLNADTLKTNEMVISGGMSEAEGLAISGMNLWLKQGEPGVAFGFAKGPSTSLTYGYLLVIKGDPERKTLAEHKLISSSDGQTATSGEFIAINGIRATIAYSMKIGPGGKKDLTEGMTINDKVFDLNKGRVFLIDLSEKSAKVQQVKADLPKNPKAPTKTEEVDQLAKEHLKKLKKVSAVKDFLK